MRRILPINPALQYDDAESALALQLGITRRLTSALKSSERGWDYKLVRTAEGPVVVQQAMCTADADRLVAAYVSDLISFSSSRYHQDLPLTA